MSDDKWTETGEAVTALVLDVFQLNGRLQLAGDRLVSELGLTSARWQILGAIAYAEAPETVAWHARALGVHRQGVQRIVNDLKQEGIVEFHPNPLHKRAQLIDLSPKGKEIFEAAMAIQVPWVNELSKGLSIEEVETTKKVIGTLKARLQQTS
jgi:DNA-binding MarR family transcriptional regulator